MFSRPVDENFPIKAEYGEKGGRYTWSIDPENGLWLPIQYHGRGGNHRGIDFDCPIGTVVRAMCDGVIERVRFENYLDSRYGSGLYIFQRVGLRGFDSWTLRYTHLKATYVKVGQVVYQGDPMAESGNSGDVLSPYLHIDLMDLRSQYRPIPLDGK